MKTLPKKRDAAFTIVELLIVIVIISVLAAIMFVAYSGIQQRAVVASIASNSSQAVKKLAMHNVTDSSYPLSGNLASIGINNTAETTYQYASDGNNYCLDIKNSNLVYHVSNTTDLKIGTCVTNYSTDPGSETTTFEHSLIGTYYGTFTRSNEQVKSGLYSAKLVDASGRGWHILDGVINVEDTIYWSFWIYSNTALNITPYWERIQPSYVGGPGNSSISIPPGVWTKVAGSKKFDSSIMGSSFKFGYYRGTPTAGETVYLDSVMITKVPQPSVYSDGNTSGWFWNGTPGNSTSTGPSS